MKLFYFLFLLLITNSIASDIPDLEPIIESIAQESEYYPFIDKIEEASENPIYYKDALARHFKSLGVFSNSKIKKILNIFQADTIKDFQAIADSLSLNQIQYAVLANCFSFENLKRRQLSTTYKIRSESQTESSGFKKDYFNGDNYSLTSRAIINYGEYKAYAIQDKDRGEKYSNGFYSGGISRITEYSSIIIGDYGVEFGMGSILSAPFSSRKGGDINLEMLQNKSEENVNLSTLENGYFRGGLIKGIIGNDSSKYALSIFYSDKNLASTIENDTATSIYSSGLFRTRNERDKIAKLNERILGGIINCDLGGIDFGVSLININYSKPVISFSSGSFYGKSGIIGSLSSKYTNNCFLFAQEISRDSRNNYGIKSSISLDYNKIKIGCLFRSFPKKFRSPFGANFGENIEPSNETGVYFGVFYRTKKFLSESYFDFYKTQGPSYFIPAIKSGLDIYEKITLKYLEDFELSFRARYENSTDNITDTIRHICQKSKYSLRVELQEKRRKTFYSRLRLETALINWDDKSIKSSFGLSGFWELAYKYNDLLNANIRISYFNTKDYNSAIWEFESLSKGLLTNKPLYGRGEKLTLKINYQLTKSIDIDCYCMFFTKSSVNSIGSGYDEIEGNKLNRFGATVEFRL